MVRRENRGGGQVTPKPCTEVSSRSDWRGDKAASHLWKRGMLTLLCERGGACRPQGRPPEPPPSSRGPVGPPPVPSSCSCGGQGRPGTDRGKAGPHAAVRPGGGRGPRRAALPACLGSAPRGSPGGPAGPGQGHTSSRRSGCGPRKAAAWPGPRTSRTGHNEGGNTCDAQQ